VTGEEARGGNEPPAGKKRTGAPRLDSRLALRPKEAAAALGLSEGTFRSLLPRLPHFRADRAVLIPVDALRRWLEDEAKAERAKLEAVKETLAARVRATLNAKK